MDSPGVPHVITRVLTKGEMGGSESETRRCYLLAQKMEPQTVAPLEAGEGRETSSPCCLQEKPAQRIPSF